MLLQELQLQGAGAEGSNGWSNGWMRWERARSVWGRARGLTRFCKCRQLHDVQQGAPTATAGAASPTPTCSGCSGAEKEKATGWAQRREMRMKARNAPTWQGGREAGAAGEALRTRTHKGEVAPERRLRRSPRASQQARRRAHRQRALLHVQALEVAGQQHGGQLLVLRHAAQAVVGGQVKSVCKQTGWRAGGRRGRKRRVRGLCQHPKGRRGQRHAANQAAQPASRTACLPRRKRSAPWTGWKTKKRVAVTSTVSSGPARRLMPGEQEFGIQGSRLRLLGAGVRWCVSPPSSPPRTCRLRWRTEGGSPSAAYSP